MFLFLDLHKLPHHARRISCFRTFLLLYQTSKNVKYFIFNLHVKQCHSPEQRKQFTLFK